MKRNAIVHNMLRQKEQYYSVYGAVGKGAWRLTGSRTIYVVGFFKNRCILHSALACQRLLRWPYNSNPLLHMLKSTSLSLVYQEG